MEARERKKSNVTPKLSLVGSPVLSRRATGKMENFVSSEPGKNGPQREALDEIDNRLLEELPAFERHEESTAIELFYDLFFVANLTTFSNIHEINNTKTLTSYVGFFCILWFTWCITSLYDIRFVTDSLLSRIAKGVHLGVMVGLAVSGPQFDTTKVAPQLKTIALILMVSRLVLGMQYLLVMYHVREYKKTKLPLALMAGLNALAGILYLGISFAFKTSDHAYRAFYVIAGFEMVVNIGVSWHWKVLTFKGTHLIERMTLLTLYILGEGVIDVLKSVAKISQSQKSWSSANIGTLFGAIAAIYLLYMLYFDTLNRHHFGSFRQQLWSFLHFPFHVALVLSLSGMAQFVIWQKIMELFVGFTGDVVRVEDQFTNISGDVDVNATFHEFVDAITTVTYELTLRFVPTDPESLNTTLTESIETFTSQLSDYITTGSSNDTLLRVVQFTEESFLLQVWNAIMDSYGFEPAEPDTSTSSTAKRSEVEGPSADKAVAALETAQLIFTFFFIATGFSLILTGVLGIVNVRSYTIWSWVRFVVHVLFGLALALLALLSTVSDGTGALNLSATAWPLPIVALVILAVLVVHHISWEDKDAETEGGKKQYHFLPRWRPNRNASV